MAFFRNLFVACFLALVVAACEAGDPAPADVPITDAPTADAPAADAAPDAGGRNCCRLKDSLRLELEAAGTDTATFVTACAQFDDTATYPATVGQELCGQLMDGRWCEWTCS